MVGEYDTRVMKKARRVALALAATAALCLPAVWVRAQNRPTHQAPPARQRYEQPQPSRHSVNRPQERRAQSQNQSRPERQNQPYSQSQPNRQNEPYRQNQPYRGMAPENRGQRPAPMTRQMPTNPQSGISPAYPRQPYPGSSFMGQGNARPNYQGSAPPVYGSQGHLGAWLNQHRSVPVQDQEKMLRQDPSFSRLPQNDQQRLVRQLHQVDQMPEPQRERRLARAQALDRLSPQERSQVTDSARRWSSLPSDRQAMMKQAFRNLREVPPDQRQTVLNSGRYQNNFNPEERGILTNLLRVEPYQPPQ